MSPSPLSPFFLHWGPEGRDSVGFDKVKIVKFTNPRVNSLDIFLGITSPKKKYFGDNIY